MGDGAARVSDVWLGDDPSERRAVAPQAEPLTLNVLVTFNADVLDPAVSMALFNEQRQPVVVATTAQGPRADRQLRRGRAGAVRLLLPQHARPRALPPGPHDHPPRRGLDVIDRYAGGLSFVVSGATASGGMVEIPGETTCGRSGRAGAERDAAAGRETRR